MTTSEEDAATKILRMIHAHLVPMDLDKAYISGGTHEVIDGKMHVSFTVKAPLVEQEDAPEFESRPMVHYDYTSPYVGPITDLIMGHCDFGASPHAPGAHNPCRNWHRGRPQGDITGYGWEQVDENDMLVIGSAFAEADAEQKAAGIAQLLLDSGTCLLHRGPHRKTWSCVRWRF